MMETNKTLEYYNKNAVHFISDTVAVDFQDKQNMLLNYLKPGEHILDFGCGSGRDSKAFIQKGYQLTTPTAKAMGFFLTNIPLTIFYKGKRRDFGEQHLRERQSLKRARSVPTTPFKTGDTFIGLRYRTLSMESVGWQNVEHFT